MGDPLGERGECGVSRRLGEPDERHLEIDARVGSLAHVDEGGADHFECPRERGRAEARCEHIGLFVLGLGELGACGAERHEQHVAQDAQEGLADDARVAADAQRFGDGGHGATGVAFGEGFEQLGTGRVVVGDPTRGDHLIEGRQCVAHRAAADADDVADDVGPDVERRVFDDPAHMLGHLVRRQQRELEVLGPAPDGGHDLVRLGGGEHEDHVVGRLFESFEERVLRARRQHVDLVEEVHLGPARGAERDLGEQVAHVVDPIVRRGVKLVEIERGAFLDRFARGAQTARLAVDRVLAVENLGEYAGQGGLARATGAREQVQVSDPVLADRVAKGAHDVLLAAYGVEPAGSVAPVQRLVLHGWILPTGTTDARSRADPGLPTPVLGRTREHRRPFSGGPGNTDARSRA